MGVSKMGYLRLLHAPIPRFTLASRVNSECMQEIAYGKNAIEVYEPDMEETEDITLWWGVLLYFDNSHFVPIIVNGLKKCYIEVDNIVYSIEEILSFVDTRKGLVIIVAPDIVIANALLFNEYNEFEKYVIIFVEEFLPSLEELAPKCPLCEGEEDYQWCIERCLEKGIIQVKPKIGNIFAMIRGRIYHGCEAYRLVKQWLPEKEYAHFRKICK